MLPQSLGVRGGTAVPPGVMSLTPHGVRYAIRPPSGDHAGQDACLASRRRCKPSESMIEIVDSPFCRVAKTSCLPSGDHEGDES